MVTHFCNLHSMAIKNSMLWPIYGLCMDFQADLANCNQFCLLMAQILLREEQIKQMVAHFCHLHSMAIKFSFMAYLWPMYGFSG